MYVLFMVLGGLIVSGLGLLFAGIARAPEAHEDADGFHLDESEKASADAKHTASKPSVANLGAAKSSR